MKCFQKQKKYQLIEICGIEYFIWYRGPKTSLVGGPESSDEEELLKKEKRAKPFFPRGFLEGIPKP